MNKGPLLESLLEPQEGPRRGVRSEASSVGAMAKEGGGVGASWGLLALCSWFPRRTV